MSKDTVMIEGVEYDLFPVTRVAELEAENKRLRRELTFETGGIPEIPAKRITKLETVIEEIQTILDETDVLGIANDVREKFQAALGKLKEKE